MKSSTIISNTIISISNGIIIIIKNAITLFMDVTINKY